MKNLKSSRAVSRVVSSCLLFAAVLLTAACSSDSSDTPTAFQLAPLQENLSLVEGDETELSIPLALSREDGHTAPIQLTLEGVTDADEELVDMSLTLQTLIPNNDNSEIRLSLDIADLPILAEQRQFRLTATDGVDTQELTFFVNIEPVDAPDIYLLIGQSNMEGFSLDGTRDISPGGPDETNDRILQLNVKGNQDDNFLTQANFTAMEDNVGTPRITTALDPLHVEFDQNNNGKEESYIGLGLTFAKEALNNTSKKIVLVPAAWAGSAFCAPGEFSPRGQWNAQETDDPNFGNTWLFDRAVARTNFAIEETGGILRGILWHQGESDSNDAACASSYLANLETLVRQLRMSIMPDARGADLRLGDSNIPFVAGTMSRGIGGPTDDFSVVSGSRLIVDTAHRSLPTPATPFTSFSIHDDLTPANNYPCGTNGCIHFGAEALREMGTRYYNALLRAAAQ